MGEKGLETLGKRGNEEIRVNIWNKSTTGKGVF
jgi:hypothetical protein